MTSTEAVVVGADIGGSTTRVAVSGLHGQVLAECRGGPGNPVGVGLQVSTATVGATVARALELAAATHQTRLRVARAIVGLAGVTTLLGSPDADRFAAAVLPDTPVRLVSDFAVAFASGTWHDRGVVTIAGTGSGAMEVDHGNDIARRDAWGWLLGDEGSGFWLGREAVRTTLRQLEDRSTGPLARAVAATLGADTVPGVLAACYRRPPRDLAELAPLVAAAAGEDDRARALLDRAAQLVADRVVRLLDDRTDLPVVLAGSLVTGSGPLARAVTAKLDTHGVERVQQAADGVAGALWLALRDTSPGSFPDAGPNRFSHPSGDTSQPARQWSALLGSLEACRRNSPADDEP